MGLALVLAPRAAFLGAAKLAYLWAVALGIYAGLRVARHTRDLSRTDVAMFSISTGAFLTIAAHDTGIQLGWVAFERPRLLAYGAPLILTAFASVLIARFARTYRRALDLNTELERAVADKRAELERVLAAERERARSPEEAGEQLLTFWLSPRRCGRRCARRTPSRA